MFAGFETTARVMATMVHHLAVNPQLQDRLRREPDLIANFTEDVNGRRDTIMVPDEALDDFADALERILDADEAAGPSENA